MITTQFFTKKLYQSVLFFLLIAISLCLNKLNAQAPVFPGCGPDSSELSYNSPPKHPQFTLGKRSFYLYDERNKIIEIHEVDLISPTSRDYRSGTYKRFYYQDSLLKTTIQVTYRNYTDTTALLRKDFEYNSLGLESSAYWYIGDSTTGKWKWALCNKYFKTYNDKKLLESLNFLDYDYKTQKIMDTTFTTFHYDNQNRLTTKFIESYNHLLAAPHKYVNTKCEYIYENNLLAKINIYEPNTAPNAWQKTTEGNFEYDSLNRQTKECYLWLSFGLYGDSAEFYTTAYDAGGNYTYQQSYKYNYFDKYGLQTKYYNSCNHRIGTIPPASPDTVIYKLSCFPNPVSTEINFTVDPTDDEISIKIHSALGKLIYQGTFQPKSYLLHLDVSSYDESIYIYEINSNNRGLLRRGKFIVSH